LHPIWEGEILTFGTYTEVFEYFENGSIKEYKNGIIKILKLEKNKLEKNGNIYENGSMKWKYVMNI